MLEGRLPTVTLRMNRSSKNAERIAVRLANHPKISRVLYPTLFTDPEQLQIARNQCDFPGGMLSIDLRGGKKAAFEFLRNLRIARNAVSLGGVETLVCHPKTTTQMCIRDRCGGSSEWAPEPLFCEQYPARLPAAAVAPRPPSWKRPIR